MRQVGILLAAIVLAGTVSACADPYYGYNRSYAYTSDAYYPRSYAPAPVYYSSGPYYSPAIRLAVLRPVRLLPQLQRHPRSCRAEPVVASAHLIDAKEFTP